MASRWWLSIELKYAVIWKQAGENNTGEQNSVTTAHYILVHNSRVERKTSVSQMVVFPQT